MQLLDDAQAMHHDLVALRRALHMEPEIGLHVPRTQERVLAHMDALPVEIGLGDATTSVTAVLRGTHPGRPATDTPAVLLRADMDGLPVQEETGLDYASKVDGAMHACGHDLHTAMLCGAVHLLAAHRDQLRGDVVFMFQPGEEMHDGAAVMVAEGVLDAAGRRVDAAYAMHVFASAFPYDQLCSRSGAMLAAADGLTVTVRGRGGHSSAPFRARDPVTGACEMVLALQTLVNRRFDVFDPVVVSVGSIHAGAAPNVIPETAQFAASVRTWSHAAREHFREASTRLLSSIAEGHELLAEIEHTDGYPVTLTTPRETEFVARTATEVFGEDRFQYLANPLAGSEDFSRVLAQVPGSFIGLGATPQGADPQTAPFNHSPHAQYDDDVLPTGTALYAELAVRRLAQLSADRFDQNR